MGSYIYPYRLCAADSLAHICWKASVRFCATSSQAQGQWVSRGPAVCIRDGLCWIPADALSSVSAAMQGKPLQSTLMLCFFLSYQSTSSANKQVYEWSCFCLTDENWKWSLSKFWRWGSSQTTTKRRILGMLNQQVQGGSIKPLWFRPAWALIAVKDDFSFQWLVKVPFNLKRQKFAQEKGNFSLLVWVNWLFAIKMKTLSQQCFGFQMRHW